MVVKYYVKMIDNQIEPGYPKQLSEDPSASPNQQWESPQMLANNFRLAIIPEADMMRETIDFQNPIIFDSYIEYPKKAVPPPQIIQNIKEKKLGRLSSLLRKKYQSKYSLDDCIFGLAGLYGDAYKTVLIQYLIPLFTVYLAKRQAIDLANSEDDLNKILLEDFI